MCRFAAYVGPPAPLSTLLYDPPRSLEVQAYAPREMRGGTVNVDGTGVAWWPEPGPALRYVTDRPPWSDLNLPLLAPRLTAGVQLAAVRSTTPEMSYGAAAVAPLLFDDLAGAHNGFIAGFRAGWARVLFERLPDDLHAAIDVRSDSAAVLATVAHRLRERADGGLAAAVATAITDIAALCSERSATATLNLLVSDGLQVVASRAAAGTPANSLYVLSSGVRWPHATVIASEPLDDDAHWTPVAEQSLVTLTPDETTITPIASVN